MSDRFRLTLAQLNPTVGAIAANAARARDAWAAAKAAGADMVALPEMFVTGYQTQDLVKKNAFARHAMQAVEDLARDCAEGPALGIGGPWLDEDGRLFNAWFVCEGGRIAARILKHHLPNYSVFDEKRLFESGPVSGPYRVGPLRIGSPICEDAWFPDVCETLAETGAEILLVPNGSPYYRGKFDRRVNLMVARVVETGLPMVYLNFVGGQDDQLFDGGSFVINPGGHLAAQLPVWEETVAHVDFTRHADGWRAETGARAVLPDEWEQDYRAMVLSLSDYMGKCGFSKVLLGLSGDRQRPCRGDRHRCAGARKRPLRHAALGIHLCPFAGGCTAAVARALGCRLDTVPISGPRAAVTTALAPCSRDALRHCRGKRAVADARASPHGDFRTSSGNASTTGNKSEVAVEHATIYGDMAGGYNPIKDLYKMRVFETCRWRNANHRPWMKGPEGAVIAQRVIDKAPSAELRADQKDEDSLPPYPVLDAILERLIEGDMSVAEIVAEGFDRATVKKVEHLVYISEYKRFQSHPARGDARKAFLA